MDEDSDDRINAADLLLARGQHWQAALACPAGGMTYGELRHAVARAATRWHDLGVEPGELIMLRGDHAPQHVVAFLGAIWAGAVPVPLRASGPDGLAQTFEEETPVRFALDPDGAGGAQGRDASAWTAWLPDTGEVAERPAEPCEPWAPAFWTEPRSWDRGDARIVVHRFALTLMAQPGVLPLSQAVSMVGVLRALRRGVTAVLHPDAAKSLEAA